MTQLSDSLGREMIRSCWFIKGTGRENVGEAAVYQTRQKAMSCINLFK